MFLEENPFPCRFVSRFSSYLFILSHNFRSCLACERNKGHHSLSDPISANDTCGILCKRKMITAQKHHHDAPCGVFYQCVFTSSPQRRGFSGVLTVTIKPDKMSDFWYVMSSCNTISHGFSTSSSSTTRSVSGLQSNNCTQSPHRRNSYYKWAL